MLIGLLPLSAARNAAANPHLIFCPFCGTSDLPWSRDLLDLLAISLSGLPTTAIRDRPPSACESAFLVVQPCRYVHPACPLQFPFLRKHQSTHPRLSHLPPVFPPSTRWGGCPRCGVWSLLRVAERQRELPHLTRLDPLPPYTPGRLCHLPLKNKLVMIVTLLSLSVAYR